MAMTRKKWSVNGLATELVVDRRTIARRLARVTPAGDGPSGPLFWLLDAVRVLGYGCSCHSTPEDKRDFYVCFYLQGFEEELEWEALAKELASTSDATVIARRIRETLLARLWVTERTDDHPPRCPELRSISDEAFDAAWTALVWEGATFGEVAGKLPASAPPAVRKRKSR